MRMLLAATVIGCIGLAVGLNAVGGGRWRVRQALVLLADPRSTWAERSRRSLRDLLRTPPVGLRPVVRAVIPAGLALTGRSPERQIALVGLVVLATSTVAAALGVLLAAMRLLPFGISIPISVVIAATALAIVIVQTQLTTRIGQIRTDIRHQLSCYLDLVSMLLAGDTGYDSALRTAAEAGSGRLFSELDARMSGIGSTGRSCVDALDSVADELELDELATVAATIRLAADEGAPVVRTLAASCSTMRSSLSSEHEAEARLRTGRLTAPLVGIALVFMALVIYPALQT